MTFDEDTIKVAIISDIHVGNAGFNKRAFLETIDEIADLDCSHVIINGDMIDAISIQDSKRFNMMSIHPDFQDLETMEDIVIAECDAFIDYLRPLQLLGMEFIILEGNHESAYKKYNGFSPYNYICRKLDAHKGGQSAFVRFEVGTQEYDVYIQHGTGGSGYTEGYALNNISRLASIIDCDLYTIGHLHRMNITLMQAIGFDNNRSKWLGVSGCFLDTIVEGHENYFSNRAKSISHIGYLVFSMNMNKKECSLNAVYK